MQIKITGAALVRGLVILLLGQATLAPAVHASERVVITAPEGFPMMASRCGQVLVAAYRRMGLDACNLFLPAERSIKTANQGLSTGELARVTGMEVIYSNPVRVPVQNFNVKIVAFTKGIAPEISSWDNLLPFRIGSLIGLKKIEKMAAKLYV